MRRLKTANELNHVSVDKAGVLTIFKDIYQLQSKKIMLNTSENISVYTVNEILRCEAQKNYTTFYFKKGDSLLVSTALNAFEKLFKQYGFFRSHHSHLINLNYVNKFIKTDGGYIVMTDASNVPVSHRKIELFLKLLSSF